MRKIYLLLMVVCFSTAAVFSQADSGLLPEEMHCESILNNDVDCLGCCSEIYSGSIDPDYLATFDPVVFNIYFWAINKSDGSTHNVMTEDDFLWAVAQLNIEYNKFNVFFKYTGFNNEDFNSDEMYEEQPITGIYSYAQQNGFVQPNSYNVYLPKTLSFGGGQSVVGNVTYFGVRNGPNFYGGPKTLIHEMGHSMFLRHSYKFYNTDSCEQVTRNPGDPNFNALTHGDCILDTAAQPQLVFSGDNPNFDLSTCTYIGDDGDCYDTPYEITEADITWMAKASGICGYKFTVGQQIRMRETIANDLVGVYAQAQTSVASLYEPYKGKYYLAGPSIPDDNPKFQPGFHYEFVECECWCPEPSDYEDVSFNYSSNVVLGIDKHETDYPSIVHPNHTAIKIVHDDPVFLPQPRKCYDNWNRIPSGGKVTKFEDDVFNTNVTVTPKDSVQINNQNLIDQLPQGLYKVEKNYDDGSSQEVIIYKENN